MSKEVKRYNFDVDKFGSPRAYESEHGRWMKRADYDALLAERDRLISDFIKERKLFVRDTDELIAERDALKQLLAETRTSMIEAIHWEDLTPVRKRIETALQGEQPCA